MSVAPCRASTRAGHPPHQGRATRGKPTVSLCPRLFKDPLLQRGSRDAPPPTPAANLPGARAALGETEAGCGAGRGKGGLGAAPGRVPPPGWVGYIFFL